MKQFFTALAVAFFLSFPFTVNAASLSQYIWIDDVLVTTETVDATLDQEMTVQVTGQFDPSGLVPQTGCAMLHLAIWHYPPPDETGPDAGVAKGFDAVTFSQQYEYEGTYRFAVVPDVPGLFELEVHTISLCDTDTPSVFVKIAKIPVDVR